MREGFDGLWNQLAYEVMIGVTEWRLQHLKAAPAANAALNQVLTGLGAIGIGQVEYS
jgi:hypothetical protein